MRTSFSSTIVLTLWTTGIAASDCTKSTLLNAFTPVLSSANYQPCQDDVGVNLLSVKSAITQDIITKINVSTNCQLLYKDIQVAFSSAPSCSVSGMDIREVAKMPFSDFIVFIKAAVSGVPVSSTPTPTPTAASTPTPSPPAQAPGATTESPNGSTEQSPSMTPSATGAPTVTISPNEGNSVATKSPTENSNIDNSGVNGKQVSNASDILYSSTSFFAIIGAVLAFL